MSIIVDILQLISLKMETLGTGGNDGKNLVIEGLKTEDLANSLKEGGLKKELIGNEKAIITDLKENCVKFGGNMILKKKKGDFVLTGKSDNKDFDGFHGKVMYINIPTVGNLKGFNFDCFIDESDVGVDKGDFDEKGLETISYSMEEIVKFLEAIRNYMSVYGVKIDENVNYDNDLRGWENDRWGCDAGIIMKQLLNLNNGVYWLQDVDETGKRVRLSSHDGICRFDRAKNQLGSILVKIHR